MIKNGIQLSIWMTLFFLVATFNIADAGTEFGSIEKIMHVLESIVHTRSVNHQTMLPPPPLPFGGEINLNAAESIAWWPPQIVAPKQAPNILLIMTDDVGFGAPSTFGGVIPTPALDRVARDGLRYTQFHSTALCSPTRAALLTGRNHHSVGFGVVCEQSTGFPGYDSLIPKSSATIAEILKQNGYATGWFGKNHNTPIFQASQAGPFDQWPNGLGFEYFYGFIGGDTSQWQPNLFRNTTAIYPYIGNPAWNLTTAMADEAIDYIRLLNSIEPSKKFFIHYAPGGTHAPHHPTPEWIEKFKGKFDMGWNVLREQIFANQKKLGVIPEHAELTPWPKDLLPEWDTLTADEKKMFARQAEVYAAYLSYTDHEIGRLIEAIEELGKLDDTLIIYISGDNGSSAEGTLVGTPNEVATFNGINIPVDVQLRDFYDIWGNDKTYPHMAVAWSWAFDTPYKWTKQIASHFGGTRQGMAISWPKQIKDAGGIRNQFHHVIDIVPTLLEIADIEAPAMVNGVPQKPMEGISLAYTFEKSHADSLSKHKTQYFEMMGDRALYHDGWIASTTPLRAPWDLLGTTTQDPANGYQWELYDLSKDWTQNNDLASSHPEKLKEMQELLWTETAKYQVLPLNAAVGARIFGPRPNPALARTEFVYHHPLTGIPMGDAPNLLNKSYILTAEVEIPEEGAEGIIATQGGRFAGWGFYLLKGKPVFVWNLYGLERVRWEAPEKLPPGHHKITFKFKYDRPQLERILMPHNLNNLGQGGNGALYVDGKLVVHQKMDKSIPIVLQWDETFDVGSDTGTPVDDKDYQVPFRFTGKLKRLTLKLEPSILTELERRLLEKEGQRNNRASE